MNYGMWISHVKNVFHQAELAQVLLIPDQLGKEIDRVAHKKSYVACYSQVTQSTGSI